MTLQPHRLPTRFTHHVWCDQPGGHRLALAVCGFIIARRESVVHPTCPVCRALLAEYEYKRLPLTESTS